MPGAPLLVKRAFLRMPSSRAMSSATQLMTLVARHGQDRSLGTDSRRRWGCSGRIALRRIGVDRSFVALRGKSSGDVSWDRVVVSPHTAVRQHGGTGRCESPPCFNGGRGAGWQNPAGLTQAGCAWRPFVLRALPPHRSDAGAAGRARQTQ